MEVTINVYPQQQNVEITTEPNVTNINVTTYAVINPRVYDLSEFTNVEVDRFAKLSDIVSSIAGYATEAWVNSQGFITNVITALGFTPENVANKTTNIGNTDVNSYPNTPTVKSALDAKQDTLTNPITGTGASGQVAFFNGTNSQTGDNGLFWDNTNKRLGVGTTTPAATLHVNGSLIAGSSTTTGLFFNPVNNTLNISNTRVLERSGATIFIGNNNTALSFRTSSTERMRITSTGQVTIGATTAGARLDVRAQGALSTDIAFRVRNSADTRNFLTVNGLGDVFNNGAGGVTTNTFYGENTGRNATGASNTGIGFQALRDNTTGANNTSIGVSALRNNTTGGQNTAIGVNVLRSNTTGAINTAIGYQALFSNTTGANNTSIGASCLSGNTTGASNTAIGLRALVANTTGSNNTAIGFDAARKISNGANLTIANNSVFLGQDTRALADNETNQIVIGHTAIGAGSNTATIGNTSIVKTILRGTLNAANLPTSAAGLVAGDIWNNGGVLNIV